MTVTAVSGRNHDVGLLANLRAGAWPVGHGEAPASSGETVSKPYAIYYRLTGEASGPLADPDADVEIVFQVSAFGVTADQVALVDDVLRDRILNESITITGRAVTGRRVVTLGEPTRESTPSGTIHSIASRYEITTTPS